MNAERQNSGPAVILSAVVKDANHLIKEDEQAIIRTRGYYAEIMTIHIQKHEGKVINAVGKNLLAEFSSVAEALHSAREIQHEILAMNAHAPKERKMNFGIGINCRAANEGQGPTYGESASIATCLADLAPGGGICISGTAYVQVKNKLPFNCDYQGDYTLDNVREPVRVYQVAVKQRKSYKMSGDKKDKHQQKKNMAQRINAVLIAAVIVGAFSFFYLRDATRPSQEVVSGERRGSVISDKPSIAVLPFVDLFKDPEHKNLSDGITSNIITSLAKFKELSIIPQNRIVAYKGRPVRIKDLRVELGVQYVVEGSVRQAGSRILIYVHLMDIKGRRLWAEKYDRGVADLAVTQDEIVRKIVTQMEVKREVAE